MSLLVELKLNPSVVVVLQSATLAFELGNAGTKPLTLVDPGRGFSSPRVRVRSLQSAAIEEFVRKPSQSGREDFLSLAPRKTIRWALELEGLAGLLSPGQYEVSLLYAFNEPPEVAESNKVTLTVHTHTPANISLAGISGGPSSIFYGAWVNVAAGSSQILRGRINGFKVPGNRQVDGIVIVAPCTSDTQPIVSEPANQKSSDDQWIAWLAGNELNTAFVSEQAGLAPQKKLALKLESPLIVEPLFCEPALDGTSVGPGGALLWSADRAGGKLDSIVLGGKEPVLDASVPCPGPKPRYARNHFRSTGVRLCYLIQTSGDAITLSYVQWPGQKTESLPLRKLGDWRGEFLAAATALDDADCVHGATALRVKKEDQTAIEVQLWTVTPKGEFAAGAKSEIEPPPDTLIQSIELALTADDVVAALLTDSNNNRYLWHDNEAKPLGGVAKNGGLAQRLIFMNGADPTLLTAQQDLGWTVLTADGRPYRFPGK